MEEDQIQHFSHIHSLQSTRWLPAGLNCALCDLPFIQDDQSCYRCRPCHFHIHKRCAALPLHINHPLHLLHPLTLAKRPSSDATTSSTLCYYCEKPFETNEFLIYACVKFCPLIYMHTKCALIPLPTITCDEGGSEDHVLRYICHQYPMALVEDGAAKGEAKCFACLTLWSCPAYSCKTCDNFIHKSCAELPSNLHHPFHSRHSLVLKVSKPRACNLCCKKDCRLIFSCEDGCDFHLGTECAFLDTIIKCRSHDHSVSLVEKASCDIHCDACGKSYEKWDDFVTEEVNRTRSFLFRCMECDFNLHFLCGPLPPTLKYMHHIDPLTLVDHSLTEDDSNEYYCDVCEERRHPRFRVYYCVDCKYVAHVHCLIFEIMEVIKGNSAVEELLALGENRWERGIKSTDDQAKEVPGSGDHNEKVGELIMRHIMTKLTKQEKEMLIDPYDFDNLPYMKQRRSGQHAHYRQLNSCFERKGSIEDFHKIQNFFRFGDKEFAFFLMELWCFKPPEGLKLDDKYLRQKVEDVDGYLVPKTLAHILKTFLRKYGDLGGKESLSPQMKSINATLLCIIIDKMCRTKVEDITKDDLKHWYFYLEGIRQITGFRIYLSLVDGPLKVLVRAFFGLEASRCEKTGVEKLHLRIAELEDELAQCKGLLEWKKGYDMSTASDFMKECFKTASELKWKDVGDLLEMSKLI